MGTIMSATDQLVWSIVKLVDERYGNIGPLRRNDVRHRIEYLVANWRNLTGRPALVEDMAAIADEAVTQSFAYEASRAIGWDVRIAVMIAFKLLEDVNAHTEAGALLEAARKMGIEV